MKGNKVNQPQRKEKFNEVFSRVIKDSILILDRGSFARQSGSKRDWPKHDPNPANCTGHGHAECVRQGEHSWFNHSMDGYYAHPELSNLPEGFVEP